MNQTKFNSIKKSLVLCLMMVFTLQAQEDYQNSLYSFNNTAEWCSELVVGDSSYYTFSSPYMYSPDGTNQGELILIREFDFSHNLIRTDSLERPGCTNWSNYADNVLQTQDGGFVVAWSSCGGHLFKFNADLSLEWQMEYADKSVLSVSIVESGYVVLGTADDSGGNWDIWWAYADSLGQVEQEGSYGDSLVSEIAYWMEPALDGGYLFSGRHYEGWNINPALWKTDDSGNIIWEKQYLDTGLNGGGLARVLNDSSYVLAYTESLEEDVTIDTPDNLLHLVILDAQGEIVEELANTSSEQTKFVLDLEVKGEDIYVLFLQQTVINNSLGVMETRLLKYTLGQGVVWERFYHRDFIESNNSFSLYDLEFLDNGQDAVELLMAGFALEESLTGSLLQSTWVLGVDCEGYPSPPSLELSSTFMGQLSAATYVFENTGTQLDSLSWWFSSGAQSTLVSPQIDFYENGMYQIELAAPYCGQTLHATAEIEVTGLDIEALEKPKAKLLSRLDLLGRPAPANYKGIVLELYEDGTIRKAIQ